MSTYRPPPPHYTSDHTWRRLRRSVLADEPWCRYCLDVGLYKPAEEVDHIVPVKRAPELWLERDNLRPLCKRCHYGVVAQEQRSGRIRGHGRDGVPRRADHHWHDEGED